MNPLGSWDDGRAEIDDAPRFSVVMPLYNKAPHLQRSVGSVLNQTRGDWELVVVDDGSTDGSLGELGKYDDPRIRLYHRSPPNAGGDAARHLAIQKAEGRWIAFLDPDDRWEKNHLERMVHLSDEFPECDMLSCGWRTVDPGGGSRTNSFFRNNRDRGPREVSLTEFLEAYLDRQPPVWTGVVCVRNNRRAADLFSVDWSCSGGDLYAWFSYMAGGGKLAWNDCIGATYHRDSVRMATRCHPEDPAFYRYMYRRIGSMLGSGDRLIFRRYINRKLWRIWQHNVYYFPRHPFCLWEALRWERDAVFCLGVSLISLIPGPMLREARRMKRAVKHILPDLWGNR